MQIHVQASMEVKMRMVFAFVMSVALAMNVSATTWYVADNGGSDSNSGKSQSSAFKTI